MKEKNTLRTYLIRYFLLILLLVGIAEFGLNFIYHNMVSPCLEETYSLSGILEHISLSETVATVAVSIFWAMLEGMGKFVPFGGYLKNFAASRLEQQVFHEFLTHMDTINSGESNLYITGILCVFILMLLVWIMPYVLAAVAFGILVSQKAAAIEKESLAQQKEYERQRNLLLSDLAHDLKTPMTTVTGYAKALSDGSVVGEGKQQEYLDAIYRKSMQMNELLLLLFEYVKLDSAGFSLKREACDLCEQLRECAAKSYMDFEEKGMEVEIEIPEKAVYYEVDQVQFDRAIHNLLVNAIKHNPPGTMAGVRLKVKSADIEIQICDSGDKIPEETAQHLFEPFVQGDTSRTGKKGSGLGLSITEKIISMHGGEIVLSQKETGEYTKAFIIRLPRESQERPET